MSYAIVGFGKIGQALAHAFARKNVNVTVASRRPPEALALQARAIGPTVVAKSLKEALEADMARASEMPAKLADLGECIFTNALTETR